MSGAMLQRAPARGEVRQLAQSLRTRTQPSLLARRIQRCGFADKKEKEAASEDFGRTFKGQLYDSTAARLQRERADQARFAQLRAQGKEAGSYGAPVWVTPLSTTSRSPFHARKKHLLMSLLAFSPPRRLRTRLHPRWAETLRAPSKLHPPPLRRQTTEPRHRARDPPSRLV